VRALITNDDGIEATGLRTLAAVAVEAGLDVVVAAPHEEYSGSSASLTALGEDGRLIVRRRRLAGSDDIVALAVEASPAFIAFSAVSGAFGPPPDVVLSGVNHGPNTGHAILHSGTVGAALTAGTHGRPALAVSLASGRPAHWETAAAVARQALRWFLDHGTEDHLVLSVNVPDVPLEDLRGLRPADLAAYGAVQASVAEVGEGFVQLTIAEVDASPEPGTDVALLLEGWATATALGAPCRATGHELLGLGE
jgi:5'-nucleotidase